MGRKVGGTTEKIQMCWRPDREWETTLMSSKGFSSKMRRRTLRERPSPWLSRTLPQKVLGGLALFPLWVSGKHYCGVPLSQALQKKKITAAWWGIASPSAHQHQALTHQTMRLKRVQTCSLRGRIRPRLIVFILLQLANTANFCCFMTYSGSVSFSRAGPLQPPGNPVKPMGGSQLYEALPKWWPWIVSH